MTDLMRIAVSSTPGAPGRVPASDLPTSDVTIACDATITQVGDVAELVGFERGPLAIDGRVFPGTAVLSETTIADGSVVCNPADRVRSDVDDTPPFQATIRTIAGVHGGRSQALPDGLYELSIGNPRWTAVRDTTSTRSSRVQIRIVDDSVAITPGNEPVVVNGKLANTGMVLPLGDLISMHLGDARYTIGRYEAPVNRRPPINGAVHRIPRVARPAPKPVYTTPPLPNAPTEPQPLSWIAMLAPIPGAAILALAIGSSTMLYFAALSPLAMIARWYDGRRRAGKHQKHYEESVLVARADTLRQIMAAREVATAHSRAGNPGPVDVVERALQNDPRLWERRPGHPDFGVVTIAVGEQPWRFEAEVPAPVEDLVDGVSFLDSVPITVDLTQGSVGVVGQRGAALGVARALMVELAVLSGPSDAPLAIMGSDDVLDDWDWAKWLPHLGAPIRLARTNEQAAEIVAKQAVEIPKRPSSEPRVHATSVFLIDGIELLRSGDSPLRQALAANNGISAIVVAADEDDLPASCNWLLSVGDDGVATVTDMITGDRFEHVTPVAMDEQTASAAAQAMARLVDPDASATSIDLPSYVSLPAVIGSVTADAVLQRWESAGTDPNPVATLGIGPAGVFEVDLVKDGPHGLLAGTTGAGKSEFLRSFVLSMATRFNAEAVNFVLVDYKGGGAFDVCAELPHTVAMVTDLDGHLGARALRSLQAELRFREITFRDAGVHDLGGYRLGGGVMPRLVVVVDEFATLAAELPEFLDALVDIAQRGRSLGIHMVLATQRPAGVVDAKIKSNTNLRISLRVQDDADSQDVLGTNDAARLRRSEMGRGFVRMGAGDIVPLQSAYAGGVTPDVEAVRGVSIEEYRLRPSDRLVEQNQMGLPTDMERMVAEINLANDKAGIAEPRKPWLPELPARIRTDDLHVGDQCNAVVGLMDVPAEQRRDNLSIPLGSANTLVYGADGSETSDTLRTIAMQAMRSRKADDLHVYLLDSGAAGLRPLRSAVHVGAYVPHDDDDLLGRVLDLLESLISDRKAHRSGGGSVADLATPLVVIDGLGALFERLNDGGDHVVLARIGALIRESAALGMSVVGSATTDRQIPGRVSSQAAVKLLHRMADPASVVSFGLRQRDLPTLEGRMIVDVATGLDGIAASIPPGDLDDILDSLSPASTRPARRLRLLRETVSACDLEAGASLDGNRLTLPIGVAIRNVETAKLAIDDRAVVLGPPGSGRTSTLAQLTRQALTVGELGSVVVVAGAGSPLREIDGVTVLAPDVPAEDGIVENAALVVVDDADRVSKPLAVQLGAYAENAGAGSWMIAAMKPGDTKAMMEWTNAFRSGSVGVVLRPTATDGDTLKVMFPAKEVAGLKVGQGIMAVNGAMTAVQAAI